MKTLRRVILEKRAGNRNSDPTTTSGRPKYRAPKPTDPIKPGSIPKERVNSTDYPVVGFKRTYHRNPQGHVDTSRPKGWKGRHIGFMPRKFSNSQQNPIVSHTAQPLTAGRVFLSEKVSKGMLAVLARANDQGPSQNRDAARHYAQTKLKRKEFGQTSPAAQDLKLTQTAKRKAKEAAKHGPFAPGDTRKKFGKRVGRFIASLGDTEKAEKIGMSVKGRQIGQETEQGRKTLAPFRAPSGLKGGRERGSYFKGGQAQITKRGGTDFTDGPMGALHGDDDKPTHGGPKAAYKKEKNRVLQGPGNPRGPKFKRRLP